MCNVVGLRKYLRLPEDTDEDLSLYLDAAMFKAEAAGVPTQLDNSQWELFIYSLAAMYYDSRGADIGERAQQMINSFVLELRHAPKFYR